MTPAVEPARLAAEHEAGHKDWFHLNVLDHASGMVGIVNASIHGSPRRPVARAVGAALVHVPDLGWVGNVEVADVSSASVGLSSIGLEHVGLAVDDAGGSVLASVRLPDDGLAADLAATWSSPPIEPRDRLRFGEGWVGWRLAPRVSIQGSLRVGSTVVPLEGASGYYDHTFGNWHWGADFRWEWGAFLTPGQGPAIVVSRATDRARKALGPPLLIVEQGSRRRTFTGPAVTIALDGAYAGPRIRRVPGAAAALHTDRASPRLPERIRIAADDGIDRVNLEFVPRGALQLIAGDPVRRGSSFIHELPGAFAGSVEIDGIATTVAGLAIVELVD